MLRFQLQATSDQGAGRAETRLIMPRRFLAGRDDWHLKWLSDRPPAFGSCLTPDCRYLTADYSQAPAHAEHLTADGCLLTANFYRLTAIGCSL
ncbi:MAG: hypothetical protein KatS3mg059_1487 [Thermomicrobiales bacterium]|nr:MAG: hypothetical protein KatS3mg059_1487 [Thermomicrobiales bacterium]